MFDTLLQDWESKTTESDEKKEEDGAAAEKDAVAGDGSNSEKKDGATEKEKAVKKGCSNLEVVAVLSHELGHWSMNHVFKNIVLIQVSSAERLKQTRAIARLQFISRPDTVRGFLCRWPTW